MRFAFTEEQEALASMAAGVAGELSTLRQPAAPLPAAHLDVGPLVETGISGLLIDEAHGGSAATMVEAAIVAEAIGRFLVPPAAVSSFLLVPAALASIGRAEREEASAGRGDVVALADVAERIVAGATTCLAVDADLTWPARNQSLAWGWHEGSEVLALSERSLRRLTVSAPGCASQDLTLLLGPAVDSEGFARRDHLARSEPGREFRAAVDVILAAVMLGHMRACLGAARGYALEREQFGVKIGSFQAIKHLLADMLVDTEGSHSMTYGAAALVATGTDRRVAQRAAAAAKAWCGDAAIRVCEAAIQVHGGIGFTWECDIHRYLRAAHVARASFTGVAGALDTITELDTVTTERAGRREQPGGHGHESGTGHGHESGSGHGHESGSGHGDGER